MNIKRWMPVLGVPLCLLLLAPPAGAQALDLSVLTGLSASKHGGEGTNGSDVDRRSGLVAGVGLSRSISPNVGVALQALYTAKGAKYSYDAPHDWMDRTAYLEVPLLLMVRVPTGADARVSPLLMAGPSLAIKLSASALIDGQEVDDGEWNGPAYDSTDLGLALGLGVGIRAGNGEVQLLGRYVAGLENAYEELWSEGKYTNQSLQLLAGYSFPLGRRAR